MLLRVLCMNGVTWADYLTIEKINCWTMFDGFDVIFIVRLGYQSSPTNGSSLECLNLIVQSINSTQHHVQHAVTVVPTHSKM